MGNLNRIPVEGKETLIQRLIRRKYSSKQIYHEVDACEIWKHVFILQVYNFLTMRRIRPKTVKKFLQKPLQEKIN